MEISVAATERGSHLEAVESELSVVNQRLDTLYEALETGRLDLEDLAPRIRALRKPPGTSSSLEDRLGG